MTRKQLGGRIGQALIVLCATYILAFLLLSALPSDAVLARYASPELGLSEAEIELIRGEYGADKPLIIQFIHAAWGFLTGNLGYSVQTGTAVSTLLAQALPKTVVLAVSAFLLACLWAFLIAVFASLGPLRGFFQALPPLMISLPSFWIGIILIQVVSFRWGVVPVIGASSVQSLILPALTLSIPIAAPLAQVLLRSMDEVSALPFIQVVRSRGAHERWIFFHNVLRNALIPTLTIAGILFGELVGGAVVTEAVFARQGIGNLTVNAVANRDTPVLLAIVVLAATVYVLINLLVDLCYPLIDPRLKGKR